MPKHTNKERSKPSFATRVKSLIKSITTPVKRKRAAAIDRQIDIDTKRGNPRTGALVTSESRRTKKRLAPEVENARRARARRKR